MDRVDAWKAELRRWYPAPLLLFHVAAGVLLIGYYLRIAGYVPHDNFRIYLTAADSGLDGSIQYWADPGAYVYQPPTIAVFAPFTLLPFPVAVILWRVLSIVALVALGVVVVHWIDRIRDASDPLLRKPFVFAVLLGGTWSLLLLLNGQVDIVLATLVWAGLYWLERGSERRAGIAIAVAASFKVFPTVLGLWMFARRQYTALAAAVATGTGVILAGLLAFGPAEYGRYVLALREYRDYSDILSGVPDPNSELLSIARPIATITGGIPYVWFLVAGLVFAGCLLATFYSLADLADPKQRSVAALVTVLVGIIAFPTGQNSYSFYAIPGLVVALHLISGRWPKLLVSGGFLMLAVPADPEELLAIRETVAPGFATPLFEGVTALLTFASVELYGFALVFIGLGLFVGEPERA